MFRSRTTAAVAATAFALVTPFAAIAAPTPGLWGGFTNDGVIGFTVAGGNVTKLTTTVVGPCELEHGGISHDNFQKPIPVRHNAFTFHAGNFKLIGDIKGLFKGDRASGWYRMDTVGKGECQNGKHRWKAQAGGPFQPGRWSGKLSAGGGSMSFVVGKFGTTIEGTTNDSLRCESPDPFVNESTAHPSGVLILLTSSGRFERNQGPVALAGKFKSRTTASGTIKFATCTFDWSATPDSLK
jgi:hypothetical protein